MSDFSGQLIVPDTGWTAAAATGSKTIALATWTAGGFTGTMTTALNTVSAGTGTFFATMDTQVAALTARLSQLEATLAANKLPNA